jgi:hypothetical protein
LYRYNTNKKSSLSPVTPNLDASRRHRAEVHEYWSQFHVVFASLSLLEQHVVRLDISVREHRLGAVQFAHCRAHPEKQPQQRRLAERPTTKRSRVQFLYVQLCRRIRIRNLKKTKLGFRSDLGILGILVVESSETRLWIMLRTAWRSRLGQLLHGVSGVIHRL